MTYAGEHGFGMTMTCRRDRLPKDVDGMYFHKEKTDSKIKAKCARFVHPVVLVKEVAAVPYKKAYRRVHVSFQSTSSCNISTVNALKECNLDVAKRERGVKANKRTWGIEMNSARALYLGTYSRIDSIDHLIKNCRLKYRSWKYWHSPMLHGMGLAIVVAYDMYLELSEDVISTERKCDPVDFWTFRETLSMQMLKYNPTQRKYPGDAQMRVCTQQRRNNRADNVEDGSPTARSRGRPSRDSNKRKKIVEEYKTAKKCRGESSRLCGNLQQLKKHIKTAVHSMKHPKICVVCGGSAYSMCTICGVYLHFTQRKASMLVRCVFMTIMTCLLQ